MKRRGLQSGYDLQQTITKFFCGSPKLPKSTGSLSPACSQFKVKEKTDVADTPEKDESTASLSSVITTGVEADQLSENPEAVSGDMEKSLNTNDTSISMASHVAIDGQCCQGIVISRASHTVEADRHSSLSNRQKDDNVDEPAYYIMDKVKCNITKDDDSEYDDDDLPVFTASPVPRSSVTADSFTCTEDISHVDCEQMQSESNNTVLPKSTVNSTKHRKRVTSKRYGLDTLVQRKFSETELAELEHKLKDNLKTSGGVGAKIREDAARDGELEDNEEHDSREEELLPEHKEQMKRLISESSDIPQGIPGERVFGDGPLKDQTTLMPDKSYPPGDTMEKRLRKACAAGLNELVCGSWLQYYYLAKPCPDYVVAWLFCYMCNQNNQHVVTKAFQTLWSWMELGKQSVRSGSRWTPNLATVCQILCGYGAEYRMLLPSIRNEPALLSCFRLECVSYLKCETTLCTAEKETKDASSNRDVPIFTFSRMIQTLTHCFQLRPDALSQHEIFGLVVLVCRCSLDLRCSGVISDIAELVSVLMDCFADDWLCRTRELCQVLSQASRQHRNLLHIANMLIRRDRTRVLQQLLSYKLLCELHAASDSLTSNRDFVPFEETNEKIKIKWLLPLVSAWLPMAFIDYQLLYTWMNLLDLCIGAEDPGSSEREDLERLGHLLLKLQSLIRDDQGRHMDRVKTKDLIFLLVGKFSVLTGRHASVQRKVDELFKTSREYAPDLITET